MNRKKRTLLQQGRLECPAGIKVTRWSYPGDGLPFPVHADGTPCRHKGALKETRKR